MKLLGIDIVLDLVYKFRAENDIDSDDKSLIRHWFYTDLASILICTQGKYVCFEEVM